MEVGQVGQTRDAITPDHIRGFSISDGSEPFKVLLQRLCVCPELTNHFVTEGAPALQQRG